MMKISKKYYISSLNGNDNNDGLSETTAFNSLHKISGLDLVNGDKIYLECGSVFNNQWLHLKNLDGIEITSYGNGVKPKINANGQGVWYQDYGTELDNPVHVYQGYVSSAILLFDISNVKISNIQITNKPTFTEDYKAPFKMDRTGIAVVAKNRGTIENIVLDDIIVRDVYGNVYNKHMNNGGIYFTAFTPDNENLTGVARYDGVKIENCLVYKTSRWGIAVGYTYKHAEFQGALLDSSIFKKYGNENIVIKNNYVKEVGGDGITPMYALKPVVSNNVCDTIATEINDEWYMYPNDRGGKVAAGIWPWKCKNAFFRNNEGLNTRLNQDGMPWDADSGDGTLYEYNYSRLNEGGCVMFCLQESINNTFRNNVSDDDLVGTISPSENPDALLENNVFYVREGVPFVRKDMGGGNFIEINNKHIIK